MYWTFEKYVGCGNDFIIFDNRQGNFPIFPFVIQNLCHRQKGVGADGLILWENSEQADGRMRIFNADGSEAEMCGNGLRCFIKYLNLKGIAQSVYIIEVMQSLLRAWLIDHDVCIEIAKPTCINWNLSLLIDHDFQSIHHLNTGVPHTVLLTDEIEFLDIRKWGFYIRHHPLWSPKGTNVTFVQKIDTHHIKARFYERGVERETLACGTGAVAAALTIAYQDQIKHPLTITTQSGEELKVGFTFQEKEFSNIRLTGPSHWVFQGKMNLPEKQEQSFFSIACNSNNSLKS